MFYIHDNVIVVHTYSNVVLCILNDKFSYLYEILLVRICKIAGVYSISDVCIKCHCWQMKISHPAAPPHSATLSPLLK